VTAWALYLDEPIRYAEGLTLQEQILAARLADRIPDTVLFLEHKPVVTLGNRGRMDGLLVQPDDLERRGIDLVHASRGGDVTYHAPGQLVLYPILKLGGNESDAHGYMHNLEEIAIRTAEDFGVAAERRKGMNGAWTQAGKIAAIGFRLKRWVSYHGMSFNVDLDLAGFNVIVPCGLYGEPIASLRSILGDGAPDVPAVRERMRQHFEAVCGRELRVFPASDSWPAEIAPFQPQSPSARSVP